MPKMRHLLGVGHLPVPTVAVFVWFPLLSGSPRNGRRNTAKILRIKSERQPLEVLDRLQGFFAGTGLLVALVAGGFALNASFVQRCAFFVLF